MKKYIRLLVNLIKKSRKSQKGGKILFVTAEKNNNKLW